METNEDFTSRVPHYTFAETLEEQEAQLETNPLMQRLNAYRKRMKAIRTAQFTTILTPKRCLMTRTVSVSGKVGGISFIRRIHRKTRVSIGGTRSATTSSTGAICRTRFTRTRSGAASPVRRLWRRTASSRCITARLSAIWLPCQAIRCS